MEDEQTPCVGIAGAALSVSVSLYRLIAIPIKYYMTLLRTLGIAFV